MSIKKLLDANIPESAVEKRSGGGGKELSYLTGAYVINRLNEIIGQGGWGYDINDLTKVFEGKVIQGYKKEEYFATSYITKISFWAIVDGARASFEEVGYGDGTDKSSPGKAHELAVKEAVTDGLKRAAKNLGISFGLGLYFKSGEYVDEQPITQAKPEASAPAAETSAPAVQDKAPLASDSKTPFTDSKVAREKIRSLLAVLEAQKKITKSEFATDYLGSAKEKVAKFDAAGLTAAVDKKINTLPDTDSVVILGKLETKLNTQGVGK